MDRQESCLQGMTWPLHLKNPSGCISRIDLEGQQRQQGDQLPVYRNQTNYQSTAIQAKEDSGLDQGGFGESVEKLSDSR